VRRRRRDTLVMVYLASIGANRVDGYGPYDGDQSDLVLL
jgi:hypothetical protein